MANLNPDEIPPSPLSHDQSMATFNNDDLRDVTGRHYRPIPSSFEPDPMLFIRRAYVQRADDDTYYIVEEQDIGNSDDGDGWEDFGGGDRISSCGNVYATAAAAQAGVNAHADKADALNGPE